MEKIYAPKTYGASQVVNLSKQYEMYKSSIQSSLKSIDRDDDQEEKPNEQLLSLIGISIEELHELEKQCSIDHLLCDGEVKKKQVPIPAKYTARLKIFEPLPFTGDCPGLEVLKTKNDLEKARNSETLLKLDRQNFHTPVYEEAKESSVDMQPGDDFVLNIFFYKPMIYDFSTKNYAEKFRFAQEHQVLGRNMLTELKDLILCISDCGIQAQVASPWEDISDLKYGAKKKYPSSTFFINGVFYNDMRSSDAIDYSENIMKWAEKRKVGSFKSADMAKAKFSDLSLRFGYPYVYIHQGNCEHIMVFADAHILTQNDCLSSQMYPRVYALNKNTSSACYLCSKAVASWIVMNYDMLPQRLSYLCTNCAQSYCYKDGQKLGKFKLFPVFQKRDTRMDSVDATT